MRSWVTFPRYILFRASRWRLAHPRLFIVFGVICTLYVLGWILTPFAYAAGDGQESPNVPGDSLHSSDGVRASHYASLFIDHGWLLDGDKKMLSWMIDLIWNIHFSIVTTGIDLFVWALSFEWVTVISTPLRTLAITIEVVISRLGIVPFALVCSGAAVAIMLLKGKFAKGVAEYSTSAIIAVLALGVLSSPIAWVVGPDGPLETARDWGANLSAAVTSGDGYLGTVEASSTEIIGASVSAPLVDVFLARPAEYLSFGHTLSGDCRTEYITQVTALDPVDPDLDKIRTAVGECDAEAKTFSDSSSNWRVTPVVETAFGSGWVIVLALITLVILFISVVATLWSALLTTWRTALAVFPYTDRSRLFVALGGIFAGLFFIVASQIFLAGFFRVLLLSIEMMTQLGWPYSEHLRFFGNAGIVGMIGLVVLMVYLRKRAKRLAERAAKAMENIGASQKNQPLAMSPAWVGSAIQSTAMFANAMSRSKSPSTKEIAPSPHPLTTGSRSDANLPHFTATTTPAGPALGPGGSGGTRGRGGARGNAPSSPQPAAPRRASIDGGEMTATVTDTNSSSSPQPKHGVAKAGSGIARYALAARGGAVGIALQAASDLERPSLANPAIEIAANGEARVARPASAERVHERWAGQSSWSTPDLISTPSSHQTIPASMKVVIGPDGNARVALSADSEPQQRPLGA